MSTKLRSIPATVSPDGTVRLSEAVELSEPAPAVVTIALEDNAPATPEPALLSEEALGDWNREEEDEAWEYLQKVTSSS